MERTDYNGNLRLKDVGRKVVLLGWVANKRNLGAIMFIDLRDTTGIVQLTAKEASLIPDIRNEYVVQAYGTVAKKDVANPNLPTGEIEVVLDKLIVINKAENPPFIIADKTDALEDTRLVYRYLDLRRPILQKRLRTRAKAVKLIHEYLDSHVLPRTHPGDLPLQPRLDRGWGRRADPRTDRAARDAPQHPGPRRDPSGRREGNLRRLDLGFKRKEDADRPDFISPESAVIGQFFRRWRR